MTMRAPVWAGRGATLLVLVTASMAAAGAVAWEAARAGRAERATAESVLRDYAEFAAWQYARVARQHIDGALDRTLSSLSAAERRAGRAAVLQPAATGADADCACGTPPREVHSFFHVDDTGQWSVAGDAIGSEWRALVDASERDGPRGRMPSPVEMRILSRPGGRALMAWRVEHENHHRVTHGFVADLALLTPALRTAQTIAPLLPPSLIERTGNRKVLSITVRDAMGAVLDAPHSWESSYEREAPMEPRLGELVVTASIDPASAGSLVIGGLPRSRLPFVYGLIALAAVLVAVAIIQVRGALALARERSDFVSGVSHELRTPLAQIRLFAETLALGRVRSPEESRRSIEIILQESQRLSQLVDNVLSFSRAERDMTALDPQPVLVRPLIDGLVDTLQPLARAKRARLRVIMPPDITAVIDAAAVRQILVNLIDNALKYGPAGQSVTIHAVSRDGELFLAVEDEGPGVADADRPHIWTPFWRGRGSAQGGSGIGLAIVRDLVQKHGGVAGVERAAGGGARFVVSLAEPIAAERVA